MLSRAIVILCCALSLPVCGAELVWDFGEAGNSNPPGFTNVLGGRGRIGRWQAVADDLPGATNVIAIEQKSVDLTSERFPMLVRAKEKFDDFTVTTKFKIVDGVSEQVAGIVFRYQDEKGYYLIRADALGNNVSFYKMVGGIRSQPIGRSIEIPKGVWHELKIECKGNKIHSWINGREALPELADTSFSSGKIGFWTKSDSMTRFADARIIFTERESRAQAIVRDIIKAYPRLLGLKIFLLNENGEPQIVASKNPAELGALGGDSEKATITQGHVYYGNDKSSVSVVQPLRDRNGDPIAAVRVTMKPFTGQTEQNMLQRALPIVKEMQARVQTLEELKP